MIKVKMGFTRGLIALIGLMSLFAFLTGIQSCQSSLDGTEVTHYSGAERLLPLAVFIVCATVLLLNKKYKEALERFLCYKTIYFLLIILLFEGLYGIFMSLAGDTIRTHEAFIFNAIGLIAGAYFLMVWLYSFILVDRFRKGERLLWYLELLFFSMIITPIAVYKLVPENISRNLNKNNLEPNKSRDQIASSGAAHD